MLVSALFKTPLGIPKCSQCWEPLLCTNKSKWVLKMFHKAFKQLAILRWCCGGRTPCTCEDLCSSVFSTILPSSYFVPIWSECFEGVQYRIYTYKMAVYCLKLKGNIRGGKALFRGRGTIWSSAGTPNYWWRDM